MSAATSQRACRPSLGALASGMLLYGMSMIYGATGTLDIASVQSAIGSLGDNRGIMLMGVVFMLVGISFKFGAAPFHMWLPDVYQGAPTAVTLLIAAAPKLAAFAITIRLLVEGSPDDRGQRCGRERKLGACEHQAQQQS